RLGMVIVLPDGPAGPMASRLTAGGLRGLVAGLAPRQVALALPRFRVTSQFGLRPVLTELGMPLAFTTGADFSGITTAERLAISEVVHQAYIDVNEQGTEAAAATAIGMRALALRRGPDPIPVVVDRPFLFAIVDQQAGLPLFLGQVARPGQ
ncbi:MAG TPA: serpin family protein, partial [Streptosporangiaceae bacterium]|nr:serpin family protein [Streptosporangiaceae bacterium]